MKTKVVCGALGFAGVLIALGQMNVGAAPDGKTEEKLAGGSIGLDGVIGPDVEYTDCQSVGEYGGVGGIQGYALGSWTCNIGDENLLWGNQHDGTPGLAMNAYRIHDGVLQQIGMSWVKHACCAAAGSGCGLACNGAGGSVLGAGCRDVYSSGWNGGQSRLGPRSDINAFSGSFIPAPGGSGSAIFKRLQIKEDDLSPSIFPNAQYFVEGVYVGSDDAAAGNAMNNASFKRVTVNGFNLSVAGSMDVGRAAMYAWADHGLGQNQPDPSVNIVEVDVPNEGRFIIGSKATDLGGTWRYDYAIFNLNSDRSGGSFSVPLPSGASATGPGFHDVPYHSGEIYDNADWTNTVTSSAVTWESPESFNLNANSNALRWGTTYNYWFESDAAPGAVSATLGMFKPGTPSDVTASVVGPMTTPACPEDVNGDGVVDVLDLLDVLAAWGPCPGCPEDINEDDVVDVLDLLDLLAAWGPC